MTQEVKAKIEKKYPANDDLTEAAEFGYFLRDEEVEKLKTVMIAAAEEIQSHWDAHCDEDGYGPSSLLRRLENGIPVEYGYTAGNFEQLRQQLSEKEAIIKRLEEVGKEMLSILESGNSIFPQSKIHKQLLNSIKQ